MVPHCLKAQRSSGAMLINVFRWGWTGLVESLSILEVAFTSTQVAIEGGGRWFLIVGW